MSRTDHSSSRLSIPLLFILLLESNNLFATDFTVTIKERGSGMFIDGATVVLDESDIYETSNKKGQTHFSEIDHPKKIKVLAAGYETRTGSVKSDEKSVTVYLSPVVLEGEGLEVTAERIVEKASKISLSKQELTQAPGSQGDPIKALVSLPGIVQAGEGSAEIYMRGSDRNENIIWVNNAPIGYLYHFGGMYSTINPMLIEDINLFLGGFPVEYGDALGGAIDVKLRAPKKDRTHYAFDISTIASSFLIEGPVGENSDDSFYIAARRSYIDLLLSPDKINELAGNDDEDDNEITLVPRFYDAQALYRHELDKGYLDYYFFAAQDKMAFDMKSAEKTDPQFAGELSNSIEYQTAGITWQQTINSRWDQITTLAYYRDKDVTRLGRDDSGKPFYIDVKTNSLSLRPHLNWQFKKDQKLSFGTELFYTDAPVDLYISRPPSEDDPDFDFTSQKKYRLEKTLIAKAFTPYIKYRKTWGEKFTSTLGLRYSDTTVSGGYSSRELSPRASLEYNLTPETLLTASWGRYTQMPDGASIIETFGNPRLDTTEAEHRILGIQHKINSLYSVKAEIYQKPMTNLVVSIDENDPPNNYANKGTGEAYGFDLFIKREARHGKMGWLSLSWAKSKRTNQLTGLTRDFSGDQPLTLTAVWGQPFGGSWKRWKWGIKAEVRSGKPYTEVINRYREIEGDDTSRWIAEYGKHNAVRTPTYYKVDLRIDREILFKESKIKLYIDLQNVTFSKNIIEYDYGNEYEKIDNPTKITGMPFFPFFGVEMEF